MPDDSPIALTWTDRFKMAGNALVEAQHAAEAARSDADHAAVAAAKANEALISANSTLDTAKQVLGDILGQA